MYICVHIYIYVDTDPCVYVYMYDICTFVHLFIMDPVSSLYCLAAIDSAWRPRTPRADTWDKAATGSGLGSVSRLRFSRKETVST